MFDRSDYTVKFKLPFLGITDKQYAALPFGRRIEVDRKIADWKKSAESTWLSQKRKSATKAISEFKDLYEPEEWFCKYMALPDRRDDTFEMFYRR